MATTTRNRAIAGGALLLCLVASAGLSGVIASSVGRHELGYANEATEGDPPEVAAGIAMGAFRGLFVNFLWLRANDLKEDGKFHESVELAKAITKLQPRFPRVWVFHAWNLAYNISVATQTPEERYNWVSAGISLLREEGIPANPNDLTLHRELAWFFLHKVGGYTDDSNQYYKRKLAQEWTAILGDPPRPIGTRDEAIALYAEWLRPVAEAPDTLEELVAADATVAELIESLRADVAVEPGRDLLLRHIYHLKLAESTLRERFTNAFGPRSTAMQALIDDPKYTEAWGALLAHVRKRVLLDEYNMNPLAMIRFTEKFGPLDWRHPGAHAVYWSHRGVERALTRYEDYNEKNFDFTNADRITMQAIQSLWRTGDVYFNYFDFTAGLRGYYQGIPNPYFVQSYGDMADEIEARGGIFESDQRVHRSYASGYENFLADAIIFFYRRGQRDRSEYWLAEYRNFENQNMNDSFGMIERRAKTLDEFVQENLIDRFASPNVAVQEVFGSLQGAYAAMLQGDTQTFEGQFEYATRAHRYFMQQQLREMVADGNVAGRMEFMDRDFRYVAGLQLANMISAVPPDEAQSLYFYAPEDLRRFAYGIVEARFKTTLDQLAEQDGSDPFEVVYPEPSGMDEFREYIAAKELERSERRLENINRQ